MGSIPAGFRRPVFNLILDEIDSTTESIRSLPDLILYNAIHNPKGIFSAQARQPSKRGKDFEIIEVSFLELALSVERCCAWILGNINEAHEARIDNGGCVQKCKPVALLLESDLTLFIYIAALLTLNIPVSAYFLCQGTCVNADADRQSVCFFLSDLTSKRYITFFTKVDVVRS